MNRKHIALAFALAAMTGSSPAALVFLLGENDPGAANGVALNSTTDDAVGSHDLTRQDVGGTGGTYSSLTPGGASTLSAAFTGTQAYSATGSGFYTGMDLQNFSFSVDVRPTGNVSGFSIAMALGQGGQGSIFLYHTGAGGAWNVHSNGIGNIITGGTVAYNTWQNLRVERVAGVLSFYVNNVQAGSSTAQFTNTGTLGDTFTIGAHRTGAGIYEGRFQGQIDNVQVVPEPSAIGLAVLGALGTGLRRRRRA